MSHYHLVKPHTKAWWKEAVVYQVYPSSFMDGNGDGNGDLEGITSKVDYLKDLGIDVVWLSPIFKSPLVDMGYDISDYMTIDPRYGSVKDVEDLVAKLHSVNMKLLLDLVVNHTSNKHAWFEASRSSKTDPKRDWYIWRPAKVDADGKRAPPTNWTASFGGSVWEWDELTQEYYLHYFCPEQPDLNWENSEVRQAVWKVMRFWLDKGVDGFRMDVINMISKITSFPDVPVVQAGFLQPSAEHFHYNGPRIHEYLQEMNREVVSKYDMMSVGEAPGTHTIEEMLLFTASSRQELQMTFDFTLVNIDSSRRDFTIGPKWRLSEFKDIIRRWAVGQYDGDGWWAFYLENHDQCRATSRWLSDSPEFRVLSSKLLVLMQMTSYGTPYVYQGQEIGMINLPGDYPEGELKDVATINAIREIRRRYGSESEELIAHFKQRCRDNGRFPMQWDSSAHGGFVAGGKSTPWMMASKDYEVCNVASQLNDPSSVHTFMKKLIQLRHSKDILTYGRTEILNPADEGLFAYTRSFLSSSKDIETVLVVLNFTGRSQDYKVPLELDISKAKVIIGNYEHGAHDPGSGVIQLSPYEGVLFEL